MTAINSHFQAFAGRFRRTPFSLERVLAPVETGLFFERYWEKEMLLVQRNAPGYYADLFSLADLDYIIACTGLRFPAVRMVRDGIGLPLERFTEDVRWGQDIYYGTVVPDKLYYEYQMGASVVFQALHRSWRPLALFSQELEKVLGHHVQTNLYLTPKAAQGFKPHYDTHDVIIMQISGSKQWRIYRPPLALPHRSQPSDNAALKNDPGPLLAGFTLSAGDMLYLPRGFVHEALTSEDESLHITLGFTTFTYLEILHEAMNQAIAGLKTEPLFRRSLPAGFGQAGAGKARLREELENGLKEKFLEHVGDFLRQADLGAIADQLARRFINDRAPLLEGQLLMLGQLDKLQPEQAVARRPGNIYRYYAGPEEKISLEFQGKTVTFPAYVAPALEFILSKEEEPFSIGEIEGNLDEPGKLTLVRRLVREGFLMLV